MANSACFTTRSANQQTRQDCSYHESGFPFIPNFRETRISQKYIHPFHTIRRKLSRLTSQKPLQRKSQECWGGKRRVHIGLVTGTGRTKKRGEFLLQVGSLRH